MNQKRCRTCAPIEPLERRLLLSTFVPPANPEIVTNIDATWKFDLNPTGTPQSTSYNDSTWTTVTLPHTWDASATSYPTGNGWYRQTVTIAPSMVGDEIYLQFQGASLSATVYVDGVQVGSHNGGWETFDVDVTAQMTAGSHLIAVDTNNISSSNIVPDGGGDYNKDGGLYRSVSILAVSKTHVALTQPVPAADASGSVLAGSGVYFSNSAVTMGTSSANIQTNTILDNLSSASAPVTVTAYLVDASGNIQSQQSTNVVLNASQTDVSVPLSGTVTDPILWDGRANPYLYDLWVEVTNTTSGQLLDVNHQQVGIRSISINANTGFSLNGQPYQLVGVNLHQDSGVPGINGGVAGWAQTDAQQENDLNIVLGTGATMVRTSHYQRDQAFYDYCDQTGLIVETEFGLNDNVGSTTAGSAFVNNCDDMLTELIRQNYNHPSIVAWSLYNEIAPTSSNATLVASLNSLAHSLDTTGRYTIGESDQGSATSGINADPDVDGEHNYDGWYVGTPASTASDIANFHSAEPSQPQAVDEFGAGGSANQFTYPANIQIPPSNTSSPYHPEDQQTEIDEAQWAAISSQKYVLSALVWTMFDFASGGRNEGDAPGINDKGLVSRDRTTYKDIYYFFQANWNSPTSTRGYSTTPVIWISDHTWTDRMGSASVPITVFSNVGTPTLTVNGTVYTMSPQVIEGMTIPDAYQVTVTLAAGKNNIQASGSVNAQTYTNSVTWTYHAAALSGTPYAAVEFTNSTSTIQSGFAPDTGQAFALQSNGATYGWVDQNANPAANTSGTYDRTGVTSSPYNSTDTQTGIIVNSNNVWQYQLPNGTYDIHIVGADSSTSNIVDNMELNGTTLHATSFSTSGGTYQEFYATVNVTNGLLTLEGGPGLSNGNGTISPQGRLSYIQISLIAPTVANESVFYFGSSAFDGSATSPSSADQNAVATDKSALVSGATATTASFSNISSYFDGINGILIDFANLPAGVTFLASDFQFKVGNTSNSSTWSSAPAPTAVATWTGSNGDTFADIVWANNAIEEEWLQVTVLADANTHLASNFVFYYGSEIGATGISTANTPNGSVIRVTSADVVATQNNASLLQAVPITNLYDYNRDSKVTAADIVLCQNNTTLLGGLVLITVGGSSGNTLPAHSRPAGTRTTTVAAVTRTTPISSDTSITASSSTNAVLDSSTDDLLVRTPLKHW
jgi:beta-galactosidase